MNVTVGLFFQVRTLLKHNVKINVKNENNETALHIAARCGSTDIAEQLLNDGIKINEIDYEGDTALHIAVKKNYKDIVKLLLEKGADLNMENVEGRTAAQLSNENDEINQIIKAIGEYSPQKIVQLFKSVYENDYENLNKELKVGFSLNFADDFGNSLLHIAVKNKNIEIARLLIKYGIDLDLKNKNKETPLINACQINSLDIAHVLLDCKASFTDQDSWGYAPIHYASQADNVELINFLGRL